MCALRAFDEGVYGIPASPLQPVPCRIFHDYLNTNVSPVSS
jgi:hypothetical protein